VKLLGYGSIFVPQACQEDLQVGVLRQRYGNAAGVHLVQQLHGSVEVVGVRVCVDEGVVGE